MMTLFQEPESKKKQGGPPNRMNDLVYRDWMKFQKSFFRHDSWPALTEECVHFFTKAVWPDGRPSRSLIIGAALPNRIAPPRQVDTFIIHSLDELVGKLASGSSSYDFILLDLRHIIVDECALADFLEDSADVVMSSLRQRLIPDCYCGILVGMPAKGGGGYPLPWAVALASRGHLRLRDEKIGLVEEDGSLYYCLFMQADDDSRPPAQLNIRLATVSREIPGWIIPRPPPRKKNEILHPAKYPETLVAEFIELFTKPGDNVFDPMVGTGSTVVAAIRTGRNGYGVDLSPSYIEISRQRVASERQPSLFDEFNSIGNPLFIIGDSTKLDQIDDLKNVSFHYAVTSPPYWSMLSNPGSEYQEKRRSNKLPLVYSSNDADLGNVQDYDAFLDLLQIVYDQVAIKLVKGGFLTVVVKNVKREHTIYPLAWDLLGRLAGEAGQYEYVGTTLWCQDDVGLKPFAVGIHWVSNTLHHYCLHFRRREH